MDDHRRALIGIVLSAISLATATAGLVLSLVALTHG